MTYHSGMVVWYFKIQTYMYGAFPLVISSSYLYPIGSL